MSLCIDRLQLQLPATLGARRHSILRQLRVELQRLVWPAGDWALLQPPPISVSTRQTNISIARHIAQQLHCAALSQQRHGHRGERSQSFNGGRL